MGVTTSRPGGRGGAVGSGSVQFHSVLNNVEVVELVAASVQERARAVVGAVDVEGAFCSIADED